MSNLDFVMKRIPYAEALAQLAEEASELAQAALKMRRVIDGTNPTPVSLEAALAVLVEETADVELCLLILGMDEFMPEIQETAKAKLKRWASRLQEVDRNG